MERKKLPDDPKPMAVGEESRALQDQRRKTIEFKSKLMKAAGGALDFTQLQAFLEIPSDGAVHDAVRQRTLLAVENNDRLWFPYCQFAGRYVMPGIQAILKVTPTTSGWRILQYLFARPDGLAGERPIDLIMGTADDIDRAVRFARVLEC